jgi:GEVED domain/Secretion system C-terminal sorting domain
MTKKLLLLYTFIIIANLKGLAQYCASAPFNAIDDDIAVFSLAGFTNISIANYASTPLYNANSIKTYSNFTNLAPIQLLTGQSYPVSIIQVNQSSHYVCIAKVWIDFNHDSIFQDPTELIFVSPKSQDPNLIANGNILNGNITIPNYLAGSIDTGITRMRVILSEDTPAVLIQPCGIYRFGETEDYLVNIQIPPACAGIPNGGLTNIIGDTSVCLESLVSLYLSGQSLANGISYQWQWSNTLNGPYTNILGANGFTYIDTVGNTSKYFRCQLTCGNSGFIDTSTPIGYQVKPFDECYCYSSAIFTNDEDIGNVSIGNLNNGNCFTPPEFNPCASSTYSDFTGLSPATFFTNVYTPIKITQINDDLFNPAAVKIWIDLNQNGIFNDNNELLFISNKTINPNYVVDGNIVKGYFTLPSVNGNSVKSGLTRMRVVLSGSFSNTTPPCGTYSFGETEDYLVNIQSAPLCTVAPAIVNAISSNTLTCPSDIFSLSISAIPNLSGITYQWLANGIAIAGANLPVLNTVSQNNTSTYTCALNCIPSGLNSNSNTIVVNTNTHTNCNCIPTFAGACGGEVIIAASVNGQTNYSGPNCANSPYYTKFTSPIFSANPGDSTLCVFQHNSQSNLYLNMWIDYNNDSSFSITEREITNLKMKTGTGILNTGVRFVARSDTGLHLMRISQSYVSQTNPIPLSCGSYIFGETEDYIINISDTVTTYTSINNMANKHSKQNINVYPNPSNSIFYLELPKSIKNYFLKVSDMLGRVILEDENKTKIDLGNFKNGTYTLSIVNENTRLEKIIVLNK